MPTVQEPAAVVTDDAAVTARADHGVLHAALAQDGGRVVDRMSLGEAAEVDAHAGQAAARGACAGVQMQVAVADGGAGLHQHGIGRADALAVVVELADGGVADAEGATGEPRKLIGAGEQPRHLGAQGHRRSAGIAVDAREFGVGLVRAHRTVDAVHLGRHRGDRRLAFRAAFAPQFDADNRAHDGLFAPHPAPGWRTRGERRCDAANIRGKLGEEEHRGALPFESGAPAVNGYKCQRPVCLQFMCLWALSGSRQRPPGCVRTTAQACLHRRAGASFWQRMRTDDSVVNDCVRLLRGDCAAPVSKGVSRAAPTGRCARWHRSRDRKHLWLGAPHDSAAGVKPNPKPAAAVQKLTPTRSQAEAFEPSQAPRLDDADGWVAPGRSQASAGRDGLAVESFEAAERLRPDDANLRAEHAFSAAVLDLQGLVGESSRLVERAFHRTSPAPG